MKPGQGTNDTAEATGGKSWDAIRRPLVLLFIAVGALLYYYSVVQPQSSVSTSLATRVRVARQARLATPTPTVPPVLPTTQVYSTQDKKVIRVDDAPVATTAATQRRASAPIQSTTATPRATHTAATPRPMPTPAPTREQKTSEQVNFAARFVSSFSSEGGCSLRDTTWVRPYEAPSGIAHVTSVEAFQGPMCVTPDGRLYGNLARFNATTNETTKFDGDSTDFNRRGDGYHITVHHPIPSHLTDSIVDFHPSHRLMVLYDDTTNLFHSVMHQSVYLVAEQLLYNMSNVSATYPPTAIASFPLQTSTHRGRKHYIQPVFSAVVGPSNFAKHYHHLHSYANNATNRPARSQCYCHGHLRFFPYKIEEAVKGEALRRVVRGTLAQAGEAEPPLEEEASAKQVARGGWGPGGSEKLKVVLVERIGSRELHDIDDIVANLGTDVPRAIVKRVRLEELSYMDQLMMFRSADVTIGVHGNGVGWGCWMQPGRTQVIELQSWNRPIACYVEMSRWCGVNYVSIDPWEVKFLQLAPDQPRDWRADAKLKRTLRKQWAPYSFPEFHKQRLLYHYPMIREAVIEAAKRQGKWG